MKALILGLLMASVAVACDCVELPAKVAKASAEIVFRGTVTSLRDSGKGYPMAVFRVARVWKGNVPETYEMAARKELFGCIGFVAPVEIGSEFLVYAGRIDRSIGSEYIPQPCQTKLTKDAEGQLRALGRGRSPGSK